MFLWDRSPRSSPPASALNIKITILFPNNSCLNLLASCLRSTRSLDSVTIPFVTMSNKGQYQLFFSKQQDPSNPSKIQPQLAFRALYQMITFHEKLQGISLYNEHLKCPAAAAKSLQSCPTLCNPRDGSPPGSAVPGILQARTLEWVAVSFSNAWKWKVKVKSLSRVWLLVTPWTAAHQAPPSMGFSRQEYWSGVPLPSLIYGSTK